MAKYKIFKDIDHLLTFAKVAKKSGRGITADDINSIRRGAIVVERGRIVWLGLTQKIPRSYRLAATKEYSLKTKTVLPAFVECHTHSVFGGNRSDEFEMRICGASYQEIAEKGGGILSTVKQTRKAPEKELLRLGQERIDRFLKQGVTTVEVKSGYALNAKDELKMLKVARQLKRARIITTYLGPHALSPDFSTGEDYMTEICERILPKVVQQGLADRADIFIEKGYYNCDQGRRYFEKAKNLGLALTIHAEQLTRQGGAALACEMGALSADHLVQVNDSDIRTLSKSETTCVLLPGADFYLTMDYPPARALVDGGARVALATDFNPGSCPTQDISLIGVLARLEMKMSLPEILTAYTWNAARSLGKSSEIGSLEVGKEADFIAIDGRWQDLFYQVGNMGISSVWSRGVQRK